MTTYQQKAEAYIREQLPELMELSFGCEVKLWTDNGKPYGQGASMDNATALYLYETEGFITVQHTKGVEYRQGSYPKEIGFIHNKSRITEIIGHPIQLQHWLRVLLEREVPKHEYKENIFMKRDGTFTVGWVDSIAQESGVYAIKFNLTTGQPATEADYQAFNEIVGV